MISMEGRNYFTASYSLVCAAFFFLFTGCSQSPNPTSDTITETGIRGEAIGFLGQIFFRPQGDQTTFLHKDSLLEESFLIYRTDTNDLNSIIWYGRRLASMYRFKDAISIYSAGITLHPRAPELYRHRGQVYIITRHLDAAIEDLSKAAALSMDRRIETEPDVEPNQLDIPRTNLRFNIYYYLGLAWYLKGDDHKAIDALTLSHPYAVNPDLTDAESFWLYHAFLNVGMLASADSLLDAIRPDEERFENKAYSEAMLMYKETALNVNGITELDADSLSNPIQQYGISNWMMKHDRKAEAASLRRWILSSHDWTDIGYIAAEADSSRLLQQ